MTANRWPDWTGRAVAIIASGGSTKKADVEALRRRVAVVAIKKNVELAPWADAVYGCDLPWWKSVRGLPDYRGMKWAWAPDACKAYGCAKVEIPEYQKKRDDMLFGEVGSVGAGGNSGFQALNLVAQLGANRVILIGFDCQGRSGAHWYGRNGWHQANNPSEQGFARWRAAFAKAAPVLLERGVDVVNASPLSDLKCFRRQGVEATLKEWGCW